MSNKKLFMFSLLGLIALFPLSSLSARGGDDYRGGGVGGGDYDNRGDYGNAYHQNYDQRYDNNYGNYGDYGGGVNGGYYENGPWVSPNPNPQYEPGMPDDSGQLYQSYMKHNNNGY